MVICNICGKEIKDKAYIEGVDSLVCLDCAKDIANVYNEIKLTQDTKEYSVDKLLLKDMQKDTIVKTISSVTLDEKKENNPIVVDDIEKTIIYTKDKEVVIEGGYLDLGINDTMKDLFVNFLGAITYSLIGFLYIKNRDKYRFAEEFMLKRRKIEE